MADVRKPDGLKADAVQTGVPQSKAPPTGTERTPAPATKAPQSGMEQTQLPATEVPQTGRFISFEGIDGSGKSTQARLLAETLRAAGHEVVLTREPGGSPGAEEIRRLVLEGDPDRWSPETEILLFTAARRDHLEKTIRPALARGAVVITDRFADSTRMYQGISRGDLAGVVDRLHTLMIGIEPDLTFLIDLPADIGLSRAQTRAGLEMRLDLQTKMRAGFLILAKAPRFRVIDGTRAPDQIAGEIAAIATDHLSQIRATPQT
jgi:dTMP kinase